VTVVFCDLTGSTALGETLDPERLRALLARYFEGMKAIVERHGGSVEKFIGTSRCSPRARRSCCSVWRDPSSASAAPTGR